MTRPVVGWSVLGILVFGVAYVKTPSFPTNDPALFEYYGRLMLHGSRLYVDLWDNKLPSIYLMNELWQRLFGERYALHIVAELALDVISVALFAGVARRYRLSAWAWATCCFAAILVLPPTVYDFTEFYAMPLILAAILAADVPFVAGACIALAATFWIPSLLLAIVFFARRRSTASFGVFILGVLAVAAPYVAVFVLRSGADTVAALTTTWPLYVKDGGVALSSSRLGFLRSLVDPSLASGAAATLAVFLALVRRPINDAQRLAVGWIAVMLVAVVLPGHPSFHYFIPSLAALMFGIAAFAEPPLPRDHAFLRGVAALAAACLLVSTAGRDVGEMRTTEMLVRSAQTIGQCIDRTFGRNTVIYSAKYGPELYLAADARLSNAYAMVDPVVSIRESRRAAAPEPTVFIGVSADVPPGGYRLRGDVGPWLLYTSTDDVFACP